MNEFDTKAAEWDKNPMHWERSEAIANEMKILIPLNKKMKALEYGAGTGITSFLLKDYLGEITLMDNSNEMVKIMNEKIKATGVKNMRALHYDLELKDYTEGTFDLIFTQMVLHHVNDIDTILKKFSKLLNPGGFLAIADLCEEDGSFHGEDLNVHKGFNIEKLSLILKNNSLNNISHKICFIIDRKISETKTAKFDVFLLTATRV